MFNVEVMILSPNGGRCTIHTFKSARQYALYMRQLRESAENVFRYLYPIDDGNHTIFTRMVTEEEVMS